MLQIQSLEVAITNGIHILHNISLEVKSGTIHALMGPNGSGKSTLAYALMGHPNYQITGGSILFNGVDITQLSADKRAQLGIFLAFQQPISLPGVTFFNFLKEAHQAITGTIMPVKEFDSLVRGYMEAIGIDLAYLYRSVNDGFSGGEKKRFELLQLLVLKPKLVILDEIDSGLDVDALKNISEILRIAKTNQPDMAIVMITHYQRMLNYVMPDCVHVLRKGELVATGLQDLANHIEQKGYDELGI